MQFFYNVKCIIYIIFNTSRIYIYIYKKKYDSYDIKIYAYDMDMIHTYHIYDMHIIDMS